MKEVFIIKVDNLVEDEYYTTDVGSLWSEDKSIAKQFVTYGGSFGKAQ